MAALTADRNTAAKTLGRRINLLVKAATKIYAGALVAVEAATGYAVPAGDTVGHQVVGRAESQADNTAGGNGAISVNVHKGVFKWVNGAAPAVQATISDTVMVQDDQSVRITSTNSIPAGVLDSIDADGGVWVATL